MPESIKANDWTGSSDLLNLTMWLFKRVCVPQIFVKLFYTAKQLYLSNTYNHYLRCLHSITNMLYYVDVHDFVFERYFLIVDFGRSLYIYPNILFLNDTFSLLILDEVYILTLIFCFV